MTRHGIRVKAPPPMLAHPLEDMPPTPDEVWHDQLHEKTEAQQQLSRLRIVCCESFPEEEGELGLTFYDKKDNTLIAIQHDPGRDDEDCGSPAPEAARWVYGRKNDKNSSEGWFPFGCTGLHPVANTKFKDIVVICTVKPSTDSSHEVVECTSIAGNLITTVETHPGDWAMIGREVLHAMEAHQRMDTSVQLLCDDSVVWQAVCLNGGSEYFCLKTKELLRVHRD